jgi:hypothetical protein
VHASEPAAAEFLDHDGIHQRGDGQFATLRVHHKHHPPQRADQPMPLVGDQAWRTGAVEQTMIQPPQGQRRKQSGGGQAVRHATHDDIFRGHQALGAHTAVPQ